MVSLRLILCLFLCVFSFAVRAEDVCSAFYKTPRIGAKLNFPKSRYFNNLSEEEILAIGEKKKTGNIFDGGLTSSVFGWGVSISTNKKNTEKGTCVFLDKVLLTLEYVKMDIMIDKKYSKESCEYKTIKKHEKQKVDMFLKTLKFYTPYFIKSAEKISDKQKPVLLSEVHNHKKVIKDFKKNIKTGIKETIDFYDEITRKEQDKLYKKAVQEYEKNPCP